MVFSRSKEYGKCLAHILKDYLTYWLVPTKKNVDDVPKTLAKKVLIIEEWPWINLSQECVCFSPPLDPTHEFVDFASNLIVVSFKTKFTSFF